MLRKRGDACCQWIVEAKNGGKRIEGVDGDLVEEFKSLPDAWLGLEQP